MALLFWLRQAINSSLIIFECSPGIRNYMLWKENGRDLIMIYNLLSISRAKRNIYSQTPSTFEGLIDSLR